MKHTPKPTLAQKATRALTDAVAKVVDEHRRQNKPLAVWRNGRIVWISPMGPGVLNEAAASYSTHTTRNKSAD